jgi:recombination protein RecT
MTTTAVATQQPRTLKAFIEERKPEIVQMLPKHVNVERFLKSALLAVARDNKLQECTPLSLFTAVVNAAELGLDFTPAKGQAYLVKYGDKAQFMPGYRGFIDLAKRTGDVARIEAHLVYENDKFDLSYGTDSKLVHVPELRKERGALIGAYAVANFKDGENQFEYMSKEQIDSIRKRSKAAQSGPWVTDYEEMARKTVVRRLFKYLPSSSDLLDKAIEADNKAIGMAEFSIEPLEDGEKTSNLADRLTAAPTQELPAEEVQATVVEAPVQEQTRRGRPPKSKEDYVLLLQDEMRVRDSALLTQARKALEICKLDIRDFTQEEAQKALLWLEQHAEKGE